MSSQGMRYFEKIYFCLFYLTLAALFLRGEVLQWEWGSLEVSCTSAKNILLALMGFGLVWFFWDKKNIFPFSAGKVLAFVTLVGISILFSQNRVEAMASFGVMLCYAGFYFLMSLYLQNGKKLSGLLVLWSVTASFVCLANIAYFSYVAFHSPVVPIVEDFPFWPGKNIQGLFLVLNISMAIGLLLEDKNMKASLKIWIYFFLVLNGASLALTFSRGAWFAMGGVVLFLIFKKPKIFIPLTSVGILLFALGAPYGLKGRFLSSFNMKEPNVQERLCIWKSALNMIQDHPFFGVGLGNFYDQYVGHYKMDQVKLVWAGDHAHNLLLHLFAEMGLLGAFFLLFGIFYFLRKGLRNYSQAQDAFSKGLVLGALLAVIGFIFYSMVDSTFNGNFSDSSMFHVNLCFMIILAVLGRPWQKSRS